MKPLTRKEQFLSYILGKSASKPKPMTREEKILDEFKPVMVVNMTEGTPCMMTCDKTFDEVYAHLINGGTVIGIYKYSSKEHVLMTVSGWRDNVVRFFGAFTSSYISDENSAGTVELIEHYVVNIGSNGNNTWAKHRVVG